MDILRRPGQPPRDRGTGAILGEGMISSARAVSDRIKARYRVRLSETIAR